MRFNVGWSWIPGKMPINTKEPITTAFILLIIILNIVVGYS
jgi:hypothetical protein